MSKPGQVPAADARDIAETITAINRATSADMLKIVEDSRAMELIEGSEFESSEPLFSPQNGLTYFTSSEEIYAEKSRIRGLLMIRECYLDEEDLESFHLLYALEHLANLQLNNSRKGHLTTLLLEHGLRLNMPQQQEKKGGFLGFGRSN